MRTLAGGWQIEDSCYVDAAPSPDRTPTPAAELEAFLAANTFFCEAYAARIRAQQCETNRSNGLYLCGKCAQERPSVAAPAKRRGRPAKRHMRDNPESPWRQNPMFIPKERRPGLSECDESSAIAASLAAAQSPAKSRQRRIQAQNGVTSGGPSSEIIAQLLKRVQKMMSKSKRRTLRGRN
ncbi:hypothetical protein GURASL_13390 [Geotalea uraniireducens]|uniref:Uncharacterized protein n=1 Tax=Geotalea uraniireducens TaxID=351604 RepID=A0ABN6VUA0_9BACT|nr:hypothetical protein [Geotalea uraniireducens]BDV42416.1 hypothetical protein GURASL_13390 [Geotalea uraniireducens]